MRLASTLLLLALALVPAAAQEAEPPVAAGQAALPRTPHAREIRSLVRALGSEDWATREAARERLLEIGPEATPWLERASRDPDAQRAAIAQELVRTLRWQVPDEVRQSIGDVLDDFPALAHEQRMDALARVAQLGPQARAAAPFLINAGRFDPDSAVRHQAITAYLQITAGDVPEQDKAALEALADEKNAGPGTFIIRSRLLDRLGRKDEALAAARQAWSLNRGSADLACYLIDQLLARGDVQGALPVATVAEQKNPQDAAVRIRMGEVLVLSGKEAEGLERLRSVVEDEAILQYQGLLLRLGQAYLRCKRVDEAEKVFRTALGRFPYNRELNVAMADVLRAAGRVEDAIQVYLSELRYATPGTTGYETLKARLRDVLRAGGATWLADTDAFYDDAHLGRPVVQVRRAVATWLRARNLLDEAAAELLAACALSPNSAVLRLELGDVRRDAGDLAGARAAYEEALRLDPRSIASARLRDVGGLAASKASRGDEAPAGFRSWEWRAGSDTLDRTGEAVTADAAPPPLVLREQVLVPAAGCTDIFGLSAEDGSLLWRFAPDPPPAEEGTLPEQLGLELLALVEAPSAMLAATDPRRAREGKPVAVAIYNSYWRSTNRSWRAARFTGLHAYVLDPTTGKALGRKALDDQAQVIAPSPVARRGRVLAFASPRAKRVVLELIDLVVARPLWQTSLPYVAMRRPLFVDEGVVVGWDTGVVALDQEGKKRWGFEHGADPSRVETGDVAGGDGPAPTTLTTDVAPCGSGVVVGTSDGRLLRLALADGAKTELAKLGDARLTGDVLVHGQRAFVAERGGRVHALHLDADLAAVTTRAWTVNAPRAAARSLSWAGDLIFALNGSEDSFGDEVPTLLAIEPATGAILLQRPVDRPATLAAGHGLVVISSGGRTSRLGLRAVGIRPAERLDARRAKLTVLETAARDALFENQFEVSAVVARMYVRAAGGYDVLDADALAFVARTLARSNRPSEALDVINLGEERAGSDAAVQEMFGALRKELKLEEVPEAAKPADAAPPPAPPAPPPATEPKPPG